MGPATQISGGSAANTIAGVASFGARGAFVGKVKDDEVGRIFRHDITKAGVTFDTKAAVDGPATARCYIMVTPDGERTMNTYLGAAQNLHPNDIVESDIADAAITYLEGYLWDPKDAKEAFLKAAKIAHRAGRMVSLTLSDAFCVDRYRAEFVHLLRDDVVDLLFANEAELKSLYETADFDTAVAALRQDAKLAAVTRSEKGCVVVSREKVETVPAAPISETCRHHRRRRSVRGRIPGRDRARARSCHRRQARRARRGGGDPASRRPPGNVAEGACGRQRPCGLIAI